VLAAIFTDPHDVRLLEEATSSSRLAAHVDFRCSLVIAHDSRLPPDTARTDTSLQSAVAVGF
jgi:hypothetical protein